MTATDDAYADKPREVTAYFSELADVYAQYRPNYPERAIDLLLEEVPQNARVADVGCGTGIFSRQLAARGLCVIAIEPDVSMLDQARSATTEPSSRIEFRQALAESTGLSDANVDLVTCAQAFHWFDASAALAEFHRILNPAGRLGLIWNSPTTDDSLSAAYRALMHRAMVEASSAGRILRHNSMRDPSESGLFANVRRHELPHEQLLDHAGFIGRAVSASYFPTAGALRRQMRRELDAMFEQHALDGRITLRYRTELVIAERTDSPFARPRRTP